MRQDSPSSYIDAAGPSDIPRLIEIDKEAGRLFEPTGLLSAAALDDHVPEDVLIEALRKNLLILARHEDAKPVGFALVSLREDCLYLDQISVSPAFGKRGIGTKLMRHVEVRAIEFDRLSIVLSTFRDVPWNAPFYSSLGYKIIKRRHMQPFMLSIEDAQRPFMDVSKRVFMRKRVRKPVFRATKPT